MKDYKKIVEALKICAGHDPCSNCCRYYSEMDEADGDYGCIDCMDKLMLDAAAAIEELVKEVRK